VEAKRCDLTEEENRKVITGGQEGERGKVDKGAKMQFSYSTGG
jgi:hypothetical protein